MVNVGYIVGLLSLVSVGIYISVSFTDRHNTTADFLWLGGGLVGVVLGLISLIHNSRHHKHKHR